MPNPTRKPWQILIVDDDPFTRDMVSQYLSAAGMAVKAVEDARAMNRLIVRECFDLIILDVLMPGEDGLSICRRIRGAGDKTPIIMVTGKSDETDRIVGLEMGADDYLGKPFNLRELQARIQAVLRRVPEQGHPAAPVEHAGPVHFGAFTVSLEARALYKKKQRIDMTTTEFALLKAFVTHPRQVMSREKLAKIAQGREYLVSDRSLDVQVARLRKLIEADPSSPRYIQTVWGVGYVFMPGG